MHVFAELKSITLCISVVMAFETIEKNGPFEDNAEFPVTFDLALSENVGGLCKGRSPTDHGVSMKLEKWTQMF